MPNPLCTRVCARVNLCTRNSDTWKVGADRLHVFRILRVSPIYSISVSVFRIRVRAALELRVDIYIRGSFPIKSFEINQQLVSKTLEFAYTFAIYCLDSQTDRLTDRGKRKHADRLTDRLMDWQRMSLRQGGEMLT